MPPTFKAGAKIIMDIESHVIGNAISTVRAWSIYPSPINPGTIYGDLKFLEKT
jgi:hypothetical protein